MIILVCGDRNWTDEAALWDILHSAATHQDTIIHGDCRGADKLAEKVAKRLGIPFRAYPANWGKYNLGAGPIRNQQMIDEEHPDLVLAFHDNLTESKGTKDMLKRAKSAGIECRWYKHPETRRV